MDIRPIRRVVTGHDAQRRAVVVMDGPATNVLHRPSRPGMALTDLWATDGTPAAQTGGDPVDRAVVLQGSITMLLDDEDVELSTGDVVIQNGTNHAWANRGHAPCLMAFVLIDAPDDPTR